MTKPYTYVYFWSSFIFIFSIFIFQTVFELVSRFLFLFIISLLSNLYVGTPFFTCCGNFSDRHVLGTNGTTTIQGGVFLYSFFHCSKIFSDSDWFLVNQILYWDSKCVTFILLPKLFFPQEDDRGRRPNWDFYLSRMYDQPWWLQGQKLSVCVSVSMTDVCDYARRWIWWSMKSGWIQYPLNLKMNLEYGFIPKHI